MSSDAHAARHWYTPMIETLYAHIHDLKTYSYSILPGISTPDTYHYTRMKRVEWRHTDHTGHTEHVYLDATCVDHPVN